MEIRQFFKRKPNEKRTAWIESVYLAAGWTPADARRCAERDERKGLYRDARTPEPDRRTFH